MLTPERLNILRKAVDWEKCSGLHNHVQPPPINFASEFVGLIARKDVSASKQTNKKSKTLLHGYSSPTSSRPFKSGSLKKNGIPPRPWPQIPPLLEWAPKGQSVWGKQQCLLLPFFWVLHLPSHLPWKHHALSNKTRHLLCCCQHRGNSHIHAPPFLEKMTTNPYASLCRKYPHTCKFLGTIPSNQFQYTKVPFWKNIQTPLSKHTWKWRPFPYGTPRRAGSASMLTTKTG